MNVFKFESSEFPQYSKEKETSNLKKQDGQTGAQIWGQNSGARD